MARKIRGSVVPYFGGRRMELPVGTERIDPRGHVMVKISMGRIKNTSRYTHYRGTWKRKHHLLWEEYYGYIPKGYKVIFLDGNKLNCEINNLALATTNEICLLHHYRLQCNNSEGTRTGLAIARQRAQLGRLMKQTHNTYNMPKLRKYE